MNGSHETDDVCGNGAGPAGSTEYAYQVERIKFDEILLENAHRDLSPSDKVQRIFGPNVHCGRSRGHKE